MSLFLSLIRFVIGECSGFIMRVVEVTSVPQVDPVNFPGHLYDFLGSI